jgi:predicted kinase
MPERVILINGLPGSGKTTLAGPLALELGCALLRKDEIKEALADTVGVDFPNLGAIAMDTVWAMAAGCEGSVIIESWWYRPRDLSHARRGLDSLRYSAAVEIWCECPGELARERMLNRPRHPVHLDAVRLETDWDTWVTTAEPLALTPVLRVDTSHPVSVRTLANSLP